MHPVYQGLIIGIVVGGYIYIAEKIGTSALLNFFIIFILVTLIVSLFKKMEEKSKEKIK